MRRTLLLLVALLATLLAPARAATAVEVDVRSLSPEFLTANQPVTLTLELTAETETTTTVAVWVSDSPIVGRSQVQETLDDALAVGFEQVASLEVALAEGANTVALTVPPATFRGKSAGVYALDVRVLGGDNRQVLLPLWREGASRQLSVVTLLPLAATPVKVGSDTFTDDAGVEQFGTEGNLLAVLRGAADVQGVTWLLDPDTVVTAQALADGGTVLNPEPHGSRGEVAAGASQLLAELAPATTGDPVYLTNYAGADVSGLVQHKLLGIAQAALRQTAETRELLGRADLATAVVARSGDFTDKTWAWLADQPVYLNVLSSQRWVSDSSTFTPSGVVTDPNGDLALVVDRLASRALTLSMRSNSETAVHRQSLYADLLITALERPNDQRVLSLLPRVVTEGLDADATAAALRVLQLPWVRATLPAVAMTSGATAERSRINDAIGAAFNNRFANSLKKFDQRRRALTTLIGETAHNRVLMATELRVASSLYTAAAQRYQLRANAFGELGLVERAVRIVSSGSVVFPGESGVVPITILNDLDVTVRVALVATGLPAVRVQPAAVDTVEIGAGKRKSIEIPTTLIGSDTAFVQLQLMTTDGRKLGQLVTIEVASSAYSRAAAVFVGVAFALLLALIVVNTVRRVRVRRRDARLAGTE